MTMERFPEVGSLSVLMYVNERRRDSYSLTLACPVNRRVSTEPGGIEQRSTKHECFVPRKANNPTNLARP